jgi:2,3,4,5-tetrahydropyridine-2-carboxylate N-succinyltransferase
VSDLAARVNELWEHRDDLGSFTSEDDAREVVHSVIDMLDQGSARVDEIVDDEVVVHEWCKQAILLLFRLEKMETIEVGPFEYADKLPLKHGYEGAKVRAVPGSSARWGSYLAPGVILMPSYVNIGARVGEGTMVDTWATVGSCAQIGARVHLSGGVGIGGVLEPPQAAPVIIGDECTIGSRSMVTQGARVGDGSVLGEGVILNPGIPVIDAETGAELGRGVVPPYCIGVQAGRKREFPGGEFTLPCVLVIRRYEPGDRSHLNEILRESGVTVS